MEKDNTSISAEFFTAHKEDIMDFGEDFLSKLSDRELIDSLAQKDLEKLARVFKLVFDKLEASQQEQENPTLERILKQLSTS